jgi:hypothetical protein
MAATRAPSQATVMRGLQTVMRRWETRAKALEDATAERDQAIRDAIEAKIPRAQIVRATGLSPQRIDQIRRGARL